MAPRMATSGLLDSVERGDVVFGIGAGGQRKLMLVYDTSATSIFARHVTTQLSIEFGRDGKSRNVKDGCVTIVSVAPLSPEEYGVVLGLDRKMRLGQFPDGLKLSKAEQQLLLNVDAYFEANPIL